MSAQEIIALIGAAGGGALLTEIVRRVIPSREAQDEHELAQSRLIDEEAARIRKELREDVESLRNRVREVEQELHDTRNAMTVLRMQHAELQIQYKELQAEVTRSSKEKA